jgi:hypothetical protein
VGDELRLRWGAEQLVEKVDVALLWLAQRDAEGHDLAAPLALEGVLGRALLHLEARHLADGLAVVGAAHGGRLRRLAELDRMIAPRKRCHNEGAENRAYCNKLLHGHGIEHDFSAVGALASPRGSDLLQRSDAAAASRASENRGWQGRREASLQPQAADRGRSQAKVCSRPTCSGR